MVIKNEDCDQQSEALPESGQTQRQTDGKHHRYAGSLCVTRRPGDLAEQPDKQGTEPNAVQLDDVREAMRLVSQHHEQGHERSHQEHVVKSHPLNCMPNSIAPGGSRLRQVLSCNAGHKILRGMLNHLERIEEQKEAVASIWLETLHQRASSTTGIHHQQCVAANQ